MIGHCHLFTITLFFLNEGKRFAVFLLEEKKTNTKGHEVTATHTTYNQ